jgi:hypothetical protein
MRVDVPHAQDRHLTDAGLPHFLIIGAMKAATSTLQAQLSAQPGIFMATPKEPNFFSDDEQWQRGIDWYRNLFAPAPADAIRGEASTHYTKLPDLPLTVSRARETLVEPRLIYLMRHPIERLISHYSHLWLENGVAEPIEQAIARRSDLVDYGRYSMQLRPWIAAFGTQSILPMFAERLAACPQEELERAAAFIGHRGPVSWQSDLASRNASGQRLRDDPLRDRILDQPLLAAIRRTMIPQAVRDRVKRLWQMPARPVLSAEARVRLARTFDPDLADLGDMLGYRLDCANFVDAVREKPLGWA